MSRGVYEDISRSRCNSGLSHQITQNQNKTMIRYNKAYIKQQRSAGLKAFKKLKYPILIDYPMDRNCSGELRAAGRI